MLEIINNLKKTMRKTQDDFYIKPVVREGRRKLTTKAPVALMAFTHTLVSSALLPCLRQTTKDRSQPRVLPFFPCLELGYQN